jgi:hypothetical protein
MKKAMPYLCNLCDRWGHKRLIRLLTILLALAVPTPMVIGGDNDREHGRFVDPIVGSWIIHVTVDKVTPPPVLPDPQPPFKFDNIAAFWEDGITTSSDPTQGTSYGLWKKTGPATYFTKIVQVNADTTLGIITATTVLTGDTMTGTFQGTTTDSTGTQVSARFTGSVMDNRITSHSTP